MNKVLIQRDCVGQAFLPVKGVFFISDLKDKKGSFVTVVDMAGERHSVHTNSITMFKPKKV